jgi:uncharacterized protein
MGRITNIFNACIKGDIVSVRKNIEKGVNINTLNRDGHSPLHLAAGNEHIALMEYLISQGADINISADKNLSPIEYACVRNKYEAVELLVANGGNLKSDVCKYAAGMNHIDLLKYLIDIGADIDFKDYEGRTALHWAAQEGFYDVVEILINKGALLDIEDESEQTPLYIASAENFLGIVNLLLKKGALVNIPLRTPPLIIAAAFENYSVVNQLINYGADINQKDSDGRTALFYAKIKRKRKLQHYLISQGASTEVIDNIGVSITDLDNEDIRSKLYEELF